MFDNKDGLVPCMTARRLNAVLCLPAAAAATIVMTAKNRNNGNIMLDQDDLVPCLP
jgi:hypothetical protein